MTRRHAIAALAWPAWALSGETGVLEGVVTDEEQRPLEGVTLKALHLVGGATSTVRSAPDGAYRFPALAGGSYSLYLAKPGYCSFWIRQVIVRPRQTTRRDVTLAKDVNCRPAT